MDGSDDYFTDDLVLDDNALAVLDQEEQKYLTQATEPINKRQRVDSGWSPGLGATTTLVDADDLPEIAVRSDGTYDIYNARKIVGQAYLFNNYGHNNIS